MKHATGPALDTLDDLLSLLRRRDGLKEPKRGVFYRRGKAWLHFHEDPAGLFADLREGADWTRHCVSNANTWPVFLDALDRSLGAA